MMESIQVNLWICAASYLVFACVSSAYADQACCGEFSYNTDIEECCNGFVVTKGNCCGGEELIYGEICCGGAPATPEKCCNNTVMIDNQECCGDVVVAKGNCCGGKELKYGEICCGETVMVYGEECCESSVYKEKTQCCVNDKVVSLTSTQKCCNNEIVDTAMTVSSKYEMDLSELMETAQDAVNKIQFNGEGCSWKDVGKLSLEIGHVMSTDCCEVDGIKYKRAINRVSGSGSFNLGTFSCKKDFFHPAVPKNIAKLYIEAGIGFSIDLGSIDIQESCNSSDLICHGPVAGNVDISGCIGAESKLSWVVVSCGLKGKGHLGTKICWGPASGFTMPEKHAELTGVRVIGSIIIADVITADVDYPLTGDIY